MSKSHALSTFESCASRSSKSISGDIEERCGGGEGVGEGGVGAVVGSCFLSGTGCEGKGRGGFCRWKELRERLLL